MSMRNVVPCPPREMRDTCYMVVKTEKVWRPRSMETNIQTHFYASEGGRRRERALGPRLLYEDCSTNRAAQICDLCRATSDEPTFWCKTKAKKLGHCNVCNARQLQRM